jgi:hypothetical protein
MPCSHPIDGTLLADYWQGGLVAPAEEAAIEEHLLGCDACGARLREVIALADGIRRLALEGSLRMVPSDTLLERAAQNGVRVREYAVSPGGSVQCTITADDDILVGRLMADLHGATRVDLSLCGGDGVERERWSDVPFHPGGTSVMWQESTGFLKAAPTMTLVARLHAFDDAGRERLLGEYTFHHTRSLPGPGAW